MPDTATVIGSFILSDPEKAIKIVRELREEAGDIFQEVRNGAQNTVKDIQEFLKGEKGAPTDSAVIIFRNNNGQGASRAFRNGDVIGKLTQVHWRVNLIRWESWNDQTSSLKVLGGTAAAFFEHENFGGKRLLVFGPASINNLNAMPGGWSDKVSSIQVVPIAPDMILENVIFPPG